jgi:hypothetical protein
MSQRIQNTLTGGGTWSGFANQKSMDAYVRKNVEFGEHQTKPGVTIERCNAYPSSDRDVSATKLKAVKFYHSDGTCVQDACVTQLQGINFDRLLNSWRVIRKMDLGKGDFDRLPEVGTEVCPRAGSAYKVVKATKRKPAKRKATTRKPAKPVTSKSKSTSKKAYKYTLTLPDGDVQKFTSELAPDHPMIQKIVEVKDAWIAHEGASKGVKLTGSIEL